MRRIVLAALLAAVAMPAWAYNAADHKTSDVYDFCLNVPIDDVGICFLRHLSEEEAFRQAGRLLAICKQVDAKGGPIGDYHVEDCQRYRAYIKQRWGY